MDADDVDTDGFVGERHEPTRTRSPKVSLPNTAFLRIPILVADILIYDSNIVPVGRDQKQHVEMCAGHGGEVQRDLRSRPLCKFLSRRSARLRLFREQTAQKDMSESYGNTIEISGEEKAVRKKIMGIA